MNEARVQTRVVGESGIVRLWARLGALGGAEVASAVLTVAREAFAHDAPVEAESAEMAKGPTAARSRAILNVRRDGDGLVVEGELTLERVERWWPHTHGAQPLYAATLTLRGGDADVEVDLGTLAFRTIDVVTPGGAFAVQVNGVDVFCRGACWTTLDIVGLRGGGADARASEGAYASAIALARAGGMNMLRVGGTMVYEDDAFYEACDREGILVWQDFMFANMDYPGDDPAFLASVTREALELLDRTETRACLAVLCGNSEIEQQAAMLGLPRASWTQSLFTEALPSLGRAYRPDLAYCPSSPSGGALPFQVSAGVSHYYGVGAYLRPLDDARRADVRFTSECLGFSNVPDDRTIELVLGDGESAFHHPAWKARVPRDSGPGWDFEDVRDHYVKLLFDVDPARVRYADIDRYLALGRVATGEVMARTFAEWRRAGSTCRGGLVWFYRDLWPGAGWGVVDATGAPKAAFYYLRRAFQSVALFLTDEGLDGLTLHMANDSPRSLDVALRLTLYRNGEVRVAEGRAEANVPPRSVVAIRGDTLFDHFLDTTYAYRFGPPGHDLAVAELTARDTGERLGDAFHFPLGMPSIRETDLGLDAVAEALPDGAFQLTVTSRRLALAVTIDARGFRADDAFFNVEPGYARQTVLRPIGLPPIGLQPSVVAAAAPSAAPTIQPKIQGTVLALNAQSPTKIVMRDAAS